MAAAGREETGVESNPLNFGCASTPLADGAHTVEAVGRACGAGTDCGTCQGAVEELITEARLTEGSRALPALAVACTPAR